MPSFSKIEISNKALARIRASVIASIDENTLEARECRRFYDEAMGDMLEGDHDWSFANQRVALAQLTNDRPNEWGYAYALPSNMAGGSSIRVLPDLDALGLGLPVPLAGDPYAETWASHGNYVEAPYTVEGSTLYTNYATATLEYGINDAAGVVVPHRVVTALTLDLASRIAVPIKNDKERESTLQAAATIQWERAIADDRNRHPQHTGGYVSETMLARRGYLPDMY